MTRSVYQEITINHTYIMYKRSLCAILPTVFIWTLNS